jgi:hypothetical protein
VRDEQGAVVAKVVREDPLYPTRLPGSSMQGKGEILPGKSVTASVRISDVYQFSHAGKYTIRVSRKEPWSERIHSNVITVTVLPAGTTPSADAPPSAPQ